MSQSDKLDLVLFGATGFTGKFCIEHLVENYNDSPLSIGLAARNLDKLKTVLSSFSDEKVDIDKFELIECDSLNPESVNALVSRAKVIITVVGPYCLYGENLITSCAKNGVDYVDLTGETHWISNMQLKCEKKAKETKARIVNIAGCMCAIADCVVYAAVKKLRDDEKQSGNSINYSVRTMMKLPSEFGESGGSAQTILNIYKQGGMSSMSGKKASYQLCPSDNKYSNLQPMTKSIMPQWNAELKYYETNGFAGAVERMLVCRSNHLLDYMYGTAPVIEEQKVLVRSNIMAFIIGIIAYILPLLLGISFLKPVLVKLMEWRFPVSGEGPFKNGLDREKMLAVKWRQYAFIEDRKAKRGVKAEVEITGDYGYYNTAKLLVEQGMIFALQRKDGTDVGKGGFLTPAVAFGKDDELIHRLNDLKQFDIKFKQY